MSANSELGDLISTENLTMHFQPIISLQQKAVVGLEALARPGPRPGLPTLNVLQMFRMAQDEGRLMELDRLCRRKALTSYRDLSLASPRPVLFINFEASVIDQGVEGSGAITRTVEECGLHPNDIVIEINESKVVNGAALRRFVDHHRDASFLIALDDLGTGESNLPRVAALRPHILKLDRSLIDGINADYFKQATFKSLVILGHMVGCLILAEGVETQAEVDTCAALGAELFQGFNFARALPPDGLDLESLKPAISSAAQRQRRAGVRAIHTRRAQANHIRILSDKVLNSLNAIDSGGFDAVLEKLMPREPEVQCAYVLNSTGIQMTETHHSPANAAWLNLLATPALKGADHSYKEYFYSLMDAGLERYTTDTYVSMATGYHCRTIASLIHHPDGALYALCLDLRVQD